MPYNYDELKDALTDYYGTAMFSGNPAAMMDLSRVQNASEEELLRTALQNGFDLSRYTKMPWE